MVAPAVQCSHQSISPMIEVYKISKWLFVDQFLSRQVEGHQTVKEYLPRERDQDIQVKKSTYKENR